MIAYDAFVATVEREAHAPRPQAERAVRATLQTLGERISGGQARDLAEQLPPQVRPLLDRGDDADPFTLQEFLRRVAEREGADDLEAAGRDAAAVFAALGVAVEHDEIEDMASELPREFDPLVGAAQAPPLPGQAAERAQAAAAPGIALESRVAGHAGLDEAGARTAALAVLETLGERISRGEVEDLAARLPTEAAAALRRGDERSNGAARPLSVKEFLVAVAEREGVTPDEAREHARAVFAALREAVGPKEFSDMAAQLPDEYRALLAPA